MLQSALSHRSATAYQSGVAAEEAVAGCYRAEGGRVRASRWRCPEGEIDLVVEMPDGIVFVEVKARRRNAAEAVTARQWARIGAAASRYLAEMVGCGTPCRFDLALVDRFGRTERIANAYSFDNW